MNDPSRILIVGDSADHREILRLRLERQGSTVSVAVDGEAALGAFDRARPDLILLDSRYQDDIGAPSAP